MKELTRRTVRRIVVGTTGGAVVAVGIAMIVLPGPAFIVIPAGLAILAAEFLWARKTLMAINSQLDRGRAAVRRLRAKPKAGD